MKIIFLVLLAFVALGSLFFWGVVNRTSRTLVVHITDSGFSPDRATLKEGEIVRFQNDGQRNHQPASDVHPTHAIYPEFDPKGPIAPGKSWSFRFDKKGNWRYHDHPNSTMTGVIVVQ